MVKKTRQDLILEMLNDAGFVTVKELMTRCEYSSATIHRDLIELEKKGLIKRSTGGAEALKRAAYPSLPSRYYPITAGILYAEALFRALGV